MRKISLVFLSLILVGQLAAQDLKRYHVKSGMIEYDKIVTGKMMGTTIEEMGAITLYFKDWGAVELNEEQTNKTTYTKIFGKESSKTEQVHQMNKLNHGESYMVDFDRKVIHLNRNAVMDAMRMSDTHAGTTGQNMLESIGGEIIGYEEILGYECEIWEFPGGSQWMYKDVILKSDITLMGIRTQQIPISAKFDVSVPNHLFDLPDYPIQKEEGFMDNEAFQEDIEDSRKEMDRLSKMSYEEWKVMAKRDPENAQMSDEELREEYDMMQQAIKMMKGI